MALRHQPKGSLRRARPVMGLQRPDHLNQPCLKRRWNYPSAQNQWPAAKTAKKLRAAFQRPTRHPASSPARLKRQRIFAGLPFSHITGCQGAEVMQKQEVVLVEHKRMIITFTCSSTLLAT